MENFETIEGEIYEIIFHNEENGYTVCEVSVNNSLITVCGHMPFIAPGEGVRINGKWINHPEYGEQFSAVFVERMLPKREGAILAYLSSGILTGVRESTAKKIVAKFGEDALDIIATSPERLSEIKGITLSRAQKISEAFLIKQEASQTVMFLQEFGVTPNISLKVHRQLGQNAIELIRENPYILCDRVERIGFITADRIAKSMNIAPNHPGRIASGIKYALMQASLTGHTCLEYNHLADYCISFLNCTMEELTASFVTLKGKNELIFEENMVFLPIYYNAELTVASRISLLQNQKIATPHIDENIDIFSEKHNIKLSPMQRAAVKMANENGILIITGGPGTGKTTIMKIIMEIFKKEELKVELCAPTGKAAKRLSDSCRVEARTLHRLLEVNPASTDEVRQFVKNEQNPLDADVVIVDEMSMVDILLFSSLLKALKRGARLILAGDSDQLASVGAGNVLCDMLESEAVKSVRLNEVFRQAEESRIVTNAHRINSGLLPLANDKNTDFFFMNRTSEGAVETICELCSGRLNKAYGFDALSDIQVLSPSRKGIAGTVNLNKILQSTLNPPQKGKKEKKFGERIFRVGDKVIQIKNNYDILWTSMDDSTDGFGIYNGDIGVILDISTANKTLTICFDDYKIVEYDFSMAEDLEIAYALTVHKSQGSEWNAVIIPVCSFPPMLMTRNLLYTAVTRAKKLVILVGSEAAISRMVENNLKEKRYSCLIKRLRELI